MDGKLAAFDLGGKGCAKAVVAGGLCVMLGKIIEAGKVGMESP
jgi:hypothetical protein